jgi:hypothetical protein
MRRFTGDESIIAIMLLKISKNGFNKDIIVSFEAFILDIGIVDLMREKTSN